MADILFQGYVYDDAGGPVSGATVQLFDQSDLTSTTVLATDTTDSNGHWNFNHSTEGRFRVKITKGSSVRYREWQDRIQIEEIETANLLVRNPANTFKYDIVPAAITADRALTLPLIIASDTLVSLGLEQTFTATQGSTEVDDGNSGASDTIDWTTGNNHKSTLTNNSVTMNFTDPTNAGVHLTLKLVQDGTGSRTVATWDTKVNWPSAVAPTLTTTPAQIDIVTFYWDGTNYYGTILTDYAPT